jgi:septum formation protein
LASGSPRRRELLKQIGFQPDISVSSIPESPKPNESPIEYTERLAYQKAADVAEEFEDRWLVAADTVVIYRDALLEKPPGRDAAIRMLTRLSGRTHDVVTGYCCLHSSGESEHEIIGVDKTEVTLKELSDETIERYVSTGEPFDKSGGYGIQDIGGAFVKSVEGSYFTVVGLPISQVIDSLIELNALKHFPVDYG